MRPREVLVLAHRWAGLAITPVILVAALTGSLLALRPQIEPLLAPAYVATPPAGTGGIDPFTLRDRAERSLPHYRFDRISLSATAGSWSLYATPRRSGEPEGEFAFDPRDGRLVAADFDHGGWPRTGRQIMRFVLDLHDRLAIPGTIGTWIFGIGAILWTLDCFVGAALTFPRSSLRGWSLAWRIKPGARGFRRHLDLHRAGGLWLWGLLLVFAWSSVWQNLTEQVYRPTMTALGFTLTDPAPFALPGGGPLDRPAVNFRSAARIGAEAVRADGQRADYRFHHGYRLTYDPARGVFSYQASVSRDPGDYGATSVEIDARTGHTAPVLASGRTVGDWMTDWLGAIHTADLGGLWFRIITALFGVNLAVIAITGVGIWQRKRRSRRRHRLSRP